MRYELRATTIHHPWRRRVNRVTGKMEPMLTEGRGIWDNETKGWFGDCGTKSEVRWESVRELNELPEITAAKVCGIFRKNRIQISTYHASGQVRGWGDRTHGAYVRQQSDGTILVEEGQSNLDRRSAEKIRVLIAKYAELLQEAGIPIHMADDGLSFSL